MKVLLSWLNEYLIDKVTVDQAEEALLNVGIEVDEVKHLDQGLEQVVVAKINDFKPHPNADKLNLCDVSDGTQQYKIVCGAKNFKKGDCVALAKIGAHLPNGLKIKASKIRGEESFGMLCSKDELGLLNNAEDGIIILNPESKLGDPIAKVLGLNDALLELELTPNRGDCLSMLGVAREIAAALDGKSKSLDYGTGRDTSSIQVEVQEKDHVDCYTLIEINNLQCQASDQKVKSRLESMGLRPINAIVDMTNYMMFETGQPLHAFDKDKIVGKITVRFAHVGEKIICLDDEKRELSEDDLVIADEDGPIAIAGVIGGLRACVSAQTCNVLLEAASFNASAVRQTSKRHKLSTDSSYRFERHVDAKAVWPSALKAAKAIIKRCGGHQASTTWFESHAIKEQEYILKQHTLQRVLGQTIPEAGECLSRLGMSVQKYGDDLRVEVPTYRHDIEREIDLVEEVARIYGYNKFQSSIPKLNETPLLEDDFVLKNKIKHALKFSAYHEVKNYSFVSQADVQMNTFWHKDMIQLKNALNENTQWMRNSLLPSLLHNLKHNVSQQNKGFKLYEMANTYGKKISKAEDSSPAHELECLSMLICGKLRDKTWYDQGNEADFYTLKGDFEAIFSQYQLGELNWKTVHDLEFLHPGKSALIHYQNKVLGFIGEIHPAVCRDFDVPSCYVLEVNFEPIAKALLRRKKYKEYSLYPGTSRDFSFVVDQSQMVGDIQDFIEKEKIKYCTNVNMFDLFESPKLGKHKKSVAFKLNFQSFEGTLEDKVIDKQCEKLLKGLKKHFDVDVRQ